MGPFFRIFILSLFSPVVTFASGFQIGTGAITPHFTGAGFHNYCNQIGHSNVITNPIDYIRVEGERDAFTALIGEDSICSHIEGAFYSNKLYEGNWLTFALLFGGYHFYMNHWKDEIANTPSNKEAVRPFYTKIGNFYFVPIAAIEIDLTLVHLSKSVSINFNNILTPIIFVESLSLKVKF
jgi:hypothetical protein